MEGRISGKIRDEEKGWKRKRKEERKGEKREWEER